MTAVADMDEALVSMPKARVHGTDGEEDGEPWGRTAVAAFEQWRS